MDVSDTRHTANQAALCIVLQHAKDPIIAIRLMCSSKAMRQTVVGHCTGALRVCYPPGVGGSRTAGDAKWLARHASLAGELHIIAGLYLPRIGQKDDEAQIAKALEQAAAVPPGTL